MRSNLFSQPGPHSSSRRPGHDLPLDPLPPPLTVHRSPAANPNAPPRPIDQLRHPKVEYTPKRRPPPPAAAQTTRKQTVLYNLFEWPSRRHARLVVVGIANTIDLPERCLPRVSSRVTSRLTFGPYTKLQVGYGNEWGGEGGVPWNQCGTGMGSTRWGSVRSLRNRNEINANLIYT